MIDDDSNDDDVDDCDVHASDDYDHDDEDSRGDGNSYKDNTFLCASTWSDDSTMQSDLVLLCCLLSTW